MEPPRDPSPATSAPDARVIFRAKRKRPTLRTRQDEHAPDATSPRAGPADDVTREDEADEQDVSVAEVLRQRRKQARLRGAGHPTEHTLTRDGDDGEQGVMSAEERRGLSPDAVTGGISGRFAPQTGLVGELVNRHMVEYVESKLASRNAATGAAQTTSPTAPDTPAGPAGPAEVQKPTVQGKLMEVDLGEEARRRNEALTERARRRLAGGDEPAEEVVESGPSRARPTRGRKRRGSDDVRRDELVEKFLHENRPDLNIPIEEAPPHPPPTTDTPADDRIAEEFKREFLDAVASRRKRRAAKPAARPGEKRPEGDVLKGPKLGGSRNVRSAVRDILLQQEKDREKRGRR